MNPKAVRRLDQIKLIMECRQSGLSNYQWCKTQNINPGTFYMRKSINGLCAIIIDQLKEKPTVISSIFSAAEEE